MKWSPHKGAHGPFCTVTTDDSEELTVQNLWNIQRILSLPPIHEWTSVCKEMRSLLSCICTSAVSSKRKPKAIGASFLVGGDKICQNTMTDLWGRQTDTVSRRTCPKWFRLQIKRLLVVARMNARPILNINPFYDEISTWKTFSSHQIALCVPSKLGVLASNKSKNRREGKKKKISVALLTEHKKKPLQRLNCFTPLHPPTLSFGRKQCCCITWLLSFPPDDFL